MTQPKPSPLDIAGLADRLFKVVKEAADMVNSFIETEVVPRAQEQDIAAAEEAERARKFRVASSTGVTGVRMPQNAMKDPFTNSAGAGKVVPMEPQPPCGATVVLGRYEGKPRETAFCMRTDGPCPYGPFVDIHATLEASGPTQPYCTATGRRGKISGHVGEPDAF